MSHWHLALRALLGQICLPLALSGQHLEVGSGDLIPQSRSIPVSTQPSPKQVKQE
jgi:hypothetical protein